MNGVPWITLLTAASVAGALRLIGLGPAHSRARAPWSQLRLASATWFCGTDSTPPAWHSSSRNSHPWMRSALACSYHVGIDGSRPTDGAARRHRRTDVACRSREIEQARRSTSRWCFLEAGLFGTFTALEFLPLVSLLGIEPDPGVLSDRLWGGPCAPRRDPVLCLYHGRQRRAAARVPGHLSATDKFDFIEPRRNGARRGSLAALATIIARHLHRHAAPDALRGRLSRLRREGAADPIPHLAAIRLRRSPDRHDDAADWRDVQDGCLRLPAHPAADFPEQMRSAHERHCCGSPSSPSFSPPVPPSPSRTSSASSRILPSITSAIACLASLAVAKSRRTTPALRNRKSRRLSGVLLQMFNHGLTAATLFWFVALLEKRSGGLRGSTTSAASAKLRRFCGLMGIALFFVARLPGLNGLRRRVSDLQGRLSAGTWATALAVLGLLITAVFHPDRSFNVSSPDRSTRRGPKLPDLTSGERLRSSLPIAIMFHLESILN